MKKKSIYILPLIFLVSCSSVDTNKTSESNSYVSNNVSSSNSLSDNSSSTNISKSKLNKLLNIDIIELNDSHGYEYQSSSNPNYNLSNISYYVNQKRALENNEVVLVANGDMFEGTAFSALSYGGSVINSLNTLDFDMMGIGNHEFSWGLDKIFNFFDNDISNYEANFPLINGNVYKSNSMDRFSEFDNNDKILPWTIVDKGDVKVGLLSYIGDLSSSISSQNLIDFKIKNDGINDLEFIEMVRNDAKKVKENGADIILLNIHGGNSNGINEYKFNDLFANLKDENNNYLIDAIINGHTHTKQSGYIKRLNGNDVPVVQASANCNGLGEINITYDLDNKKIVTTQANSYDLSSLVSANLKDEICQDVLDEEYEKVREIISEELCEFEYYASKTQLAKFMCDVLVKYLDADVAFFNNSSFRTMLPTGIIKVEDLYNLYPFENKLVYLKIKGSSLKKWYKEEYNYQGFNSKFDESLLDDNTYYNVVTIDYTFYSTYFKKYVSDYELIKEYDIKLRDVVKEELKLHKGSKFNIYDYDIRINSYDFNLN